MDKRERRDSALERKKKGDKSKRRVETERKRDM